MKMHCPRCKHETHFEPDPGTRHACLRCLSADNFVYMVVGCPPAPPSAPTPDPKIQVRMVDLELLASRTQGLRQWILLRRPAIPEVTPSSIALDTLFWHTEIVRQTLQLEDNAIALVLRELGEWYQGTVTYRPVDRRHREGADG